MGSRKRSAREREVAAFRANLDAMAQDGRADELFSHERERRESLSREREGALRRKACESKNRYPTRSDAEAAAKACADLGRRGLRTYKCPYCNGWHLTSKKPL